jgi:hypothetical protein
MILLLLPDLYDERNKIYLNLYFTKLNRIEDKEYFLTNFKDKTLINTIRIISDLFNKYNFYHPEILLYTKTTSDSKLLTRWQRNYYIDIYSEYINAKENKNSKLTELYSLLQSNSSFVFLTTLFNDLNKVEDEHKDFNKALKKIFTYYNFKKDSPFKQYSKKENNEKIKQYESLLFSGKSVFEVLDTKEKEQVKKSIDFFYSRIRG